MEKDYTFIGKQIDYIIQSIRCNLEFQNKLYKVVAFEEIPILDESINFAIEALWHFVCEARGVPELDHTEFECFNDCIYELASDQEIYCFDINHCQLNINDGLSLMNNMFGNEAYFNYLIKNICEDEAYFN